MSLFPKLITDTEVALWSRQSRLNVFKYVLLHCGQLLKLAIKIALSHIKEDKLKEEHTEILIKEIRKNQ